MSAATPRGGSVPIATPLGRARPVPWSAGLRSIRVEPQIRSDLASVAVGVALSIFLVLGMAMVGETSIPAVAVVAVGAAILRPAVGMTVLAIMIPLREPAVFPPAFFNFVLAAATFAGCIFRLPVERPRIVPTTAFLLLVGYLLYSVASLPPDVSGFSADTAASATYQFIQLAAGVVVFMAGYLVFQRVDPEPILLAGVAAAAFGAILAIVFLSAGGDDLPFRALYSPAEWVARAVGTFGNSNYYGLFLALTILLAMGLFGVGGRGRRALLVPVIALLGIALVLTFSRGSFLALGVGIVVWAFLRNRPLGVAMAITSVLVVAVALPIFLEVRLDLTESVRDDAQASLTASDQSRLTAALSGFGLAAESPLFGIGFGQYQTASAEEIIGATNTYPHNAAIKVLAEQGVIGAVIAGVIVLLLLRSIVRAVHPLRRTAIAVMAAYLAGSILAEPFWTIQTSGLTWILLAAVLAPIPRSAPSSDPDPDEVDAHSRAWSPIPVGA